MAAGVGGNGGGPSSATSSRRRSDADGSGQGSVVASAAPHVPRGIYLFSCLGTLVFTLFAVASYVFGFGDPELMALHKAQVAPEAYLVPACCFTTAFCLNALTMLFERDGQKFQLAFLGAYIQLLAAANDYISYAGAAPIMRGWYPPSSGGVHVLRYVMWTLTTPFMVYLLSKLSDFRQDKVILAVVTDVLMLVTGTLGDVVTSMPLALVFNAISWGAFPFLIRMMWCMFDGAIMHSTSHANKINLQVLRLFTVGFWFLFPVLHAIKRTGMLDLFVEEWLWTLCDFVGKVMFSSSLMFENFLTIEQRRIMAMHIVEASNRTQVIEELKSLVEHKERFMSSMSHELRTPLNGIIGLSDALLIGSCGEISDAVRRTLSTIKTSGARLLNLINDILDASAMRHGKLTIKQERVQLHQLVDDVLDLCRPLAKPKVKLVNNLPRNCPPILGDTGRIIQVLHNIVGNSCKFTHAGTITVGATVSPAGDSLKLSICDTGIGIPAEKFDQIFEAFQQVDMSTTRKYGGTGLGLNIVKTLVEAHNSTVEITSKLGQGTCFSFVLKVWDASKDASSDPPPAAAAAMTTEQPQLDEEDLALGIPAAGAAGPLRKMIQASRVRASQSRSSLGTASPSASRAALASGAPAGQGAVSPSRGSLSGLSAAQPASAAGTGTGLRRSSGDRPARGSTETKAAAAAAAGSAAAAASGSGQAAAGSGTAAAASAAKPGQWQATVLRSTSLSRFEGRQVAMPSMAEGDAETGAAEDGGQLEGATDGVRGGAVSGTSVAAEVVPQASVEGQQGVAAGVAQSGAGGGSSSHAASSLPKPGALAASAAAASSAEQAQLAQDGASKGTGTAAGGSMAVVVAGQALGPAAAAGASGTGQERGPLQRRSSRLRRRVLSVDDDPVNQLVMQSLLQPEGYEVIQAMNGFEALQYMEEAESLPDIILLDVMMPGMSGYEVCRKVRELYPNSCIPIIMVSAKRAEEHIVEGLSSGSNDYIVKPFGRQEILARVAAHLKFRDSVYRAGEEAAEEDLLAGWMDMPDQLLSCLRMGNKYFSLPNSVKSQLENMSNHPSIMVFNQLTMVVAEVCHLEELTRTVAPDCMLGALASLFIYIEELLAQHPCYLVDCLEGRIVVVTGLAGDAGAEQVEAALGFAKGLQEAASRIKLTDTSCIQLSVGVHTCAAQGVIVGVHHPVLHFTGNLPERASRLQSTCPPGCVQISAQALEQLGPSHRPDFALAVDSGNDSTFLLKAGAWEARLRQVPANLARYLSQHPFGPLNTGAYRLRPIQLALVSMVWADAGLLLGLVNSLNSMGAKAAPGGIHPVSGSSPIAGGSLQLTAHGSSSPQHRVSLQGLPHGSAQLLSQGSLKGRVSTAGDAAHALVAQLQHEKELLGRQLESVEQECERLQTTVESLELELQSQPTMQRSASQHSLAHSTHSQHYPSHTPHLGVPQAQHSQGFLPTPSPDHSPRWPGGAVGGGAGMGVGAVSAREHREVLSAYQGAADALERIEREMCQCRQERDDAIAMLEAAEERVQQLGTQVEQLQAQVVEAQVRLQARLSTPRRNLTRGPSILGSGHAYGTLLGRRRRSSGMARQDSGQSTLGELPYTSSSGSPWQQGILLGRGSMESSAPSSASIRSFLEDVGLGHVANRFEAEEITPPMLPLLDDRQLRDLGVYTMGQRVRLKLALDALVQPDTGYGEDMAYVEGVDQGVEGVGPVLEEPEGAAMDEGQE